jgi:phosphoribosylpyrophosphate synthetase
MFDTAGTIANSAALLHQEGAREVYACCTHAVFRYILSWSNCQLGSRFLKPMFAEDVAAKWLPFEYGVWATMLNLELT